MMSAVLIALAGCSKSSEQPASAGPNGGDLVPIKDGAAYAEVLANPDTGEVMVHTWDKDMKTRRAIEPEPISVGSGQNSVELTPRPTDTDPAGTSSRFYGQADWVRGGGVSRGWMQARGTRERQEFEWQRGWEAGRTHGRMWEEMGEHRRMGPRHGPGPGGPMER
jgi:hypothetical protein